MVAGSGARRGTESLAARVSAGPRAVYGWASMQVRRRVSWSSAVLATVAAQLVACRQEPPPPPSSAPSEPVVLVGVDAKDFRCESLLSLAQLGELLGGRVRQLESASPTPIGVPSPCAYLLEAEGAAAAGWTFDLDCRDGMDARAEALFAQYQRTSAEVAARLAAEGPAGQRAAPSEVTAREVQVGARALDHHGQGLLFVDDDAPCYVRVVGPSAAGRLALATHLARALTPATAPMTRRRASSVAPPGPTRQ